MMNKIQSLLYIALYPDLISVLAMISAEHQTSVQVLMMLGPPAT